MMRRRSPWSASAPPTKMSSSTGAPRAKASSPSRKGEAPRLNISHGCATCCAQVPILASRLANQKVPKRRVPSRRREFRKATLGMGKGRRARVGTDKLTSRISGRLGRSASRSSKLPIGRSEEERKRGREEERKSAFSCTSRGTSWGLCNVTAFDTLRTSESSAHRWLRNSGWLQRTPISDCNVLLHLFAYKTACSSFLAHILHLRMYTRLNSTTWCTSQPLLMTARRRSPQPRKPGYHASSQHYLGRALGRWPDCISRSRTTLMQRGNALRQPVQPLLMSHPAIRRWCTNCSLLVHRYWARPTWISLPAA